MTLLHVNLVARDAVALAAFYLAVFGCHSVRTPRRLSGETVARGNGLPGCEIEAIWLGFPGRAGPFLEIHQHMEMLERPRPEVNAPGFGHLSFQVDSLAAVLAVVLAAGGEMVGEVVDFGTAEAPFLIAYVRDPEGNILELEQG